MQVWRSAKIFISSTFLDLESERDDLAKICARLKQKMTRRNLSLTSYDLRWQERHDREPIARWCVNMVKRSQCFVGILGYRYGWRPPVDGLNKPNSKNISVTEMEINRTFLSIPKERRFFCFCDEETYNKEQKQKQSEEDKKSMQILRQKLQDQGEQIYIYRDSREMLQIVEKKLEQILNTAYPVVVEQESKYTRKEALREIIELKGKGFVGRDKFLEQLEQFAMGEDDNYLVIKAVAGSGKSALLARFIENYRKKPNRNIVIHFMGMSQESKQVREIMLHIAEQLKELAIIDHFPEDPVEMRSFIRNALEHCSHKLLIVIDGLDEIEDGGRDLLWLSRNLPTNVRVIITCRPIAPLEVIQSYSRLQQWELPALSTPEIEEIIDIFSAKQEINIAENDRAILIKRAGGSPLYLKVALEEVGAGGVAAGQMASSIDSLFAQVLQRLCREYGEQELNSYLGFIAAGRSGMAEHELHELLCQTENNVSDEVFITITDALANFVVERRRIFHFFHPEFERAVKQNLGRGNMRSYHAGLAEYFRNKGFEYERGLFEICYQYQWAERYQNLLALLTDLSFLEAKVGAGMIDDLVMDFERALIETAVPMPETISLDIVEGMPVGKETLRLVNKVLNLDIGFIRRYPDSLFQCLWNRCFWHDNPHANSFYLGGEHQSKLYRLAQYWQENRDADQVWIKSQRPLTPHLESPLKKSITGHKGAVHCLALRSDEKRVISGGKDHSACLWDMISGECLAVLDGHENPVHSVDFSDDGKLAATAAAKEWGVFVWDAQNGECVQILENKEGCVQIVAFIPGKKQLAGACDDGSVVIWDIDRGELIQSFRAHQKTILAMAFDKEGRIATASTDMTIKLWDKSYSCRKELIGHNKMVTDVTWFPDGKLVVSCSKDGTIRLWQSDTAKCIHVFEGHQNVVNTVAVSSDGKFIFSGSNDNTVIIWDVEKKEKLVAFSKANWHVTDLLLSNDQKTMVCSATDGTISLWDATRRKIPVPLDGHKEAIQSADYGDGIMVTVSQDQRACFWDLNSAKCIQTVETEEALTSVVFAEKNTWAAWASEAGTIQIWNTETQESHSSFSAHKGAVTKLRFGKNDKILISAGFFDKTLRLWDVSDNKCWHELGGHTSWIQDFALTSDERFLASGSRDKNIMLWDLQSGKCIKVLRGHDKSITVLCFSPDDRWLASGAYDGMVHIWNRETGACQMIFKAHEGCITDIAFADNQKLLTVSNFDLATAVVSEQHMLNDKQSGGLGQKRFHSSKIWNIENGHCIEKKDGRLKISEFLRSDIPYYAITNPWQTDIIDKESDNIVARFNFPLSHIRFHTKNKLSGVTSAGICILTLENEK